MHSLKLADTDCANRSGDALGRALVVIARHDERQSEQQRPGAHVPGFDEWQEQWKSNSELIGQRLQLIDAELDRISREATDSPQLNVFDDAPSIH